jgi:3',5'-cyclic-AMP phosphodiesterase
MKSVLQLTDLHIFEDANRTLLPIDTKESFKRVLDFALADDEDWDLIVLSGDLADLGEAASYAWIAEVFSELEIPTVAVAGNHDDRAHLEKYFQCPSALSLGEWQISLLDSCPLSKVTGELGEKELIGLRQRIEAHPENPHLIFLHHPPISLNSSWMDGMGLKNASAFWDCIENQDNVVAVVNGHVHQNFDTYREGVRVLSSPSTCTQFVPRTDRFALDPRPPGYRKLKLSDDGDIITEVKRVPSA